MGLTTPNPPTGLMASFPGQKGTGAPLPNQVVGLMATVVNAGQVNLAWTAVALAASYTVSRNGAVIASGVPGVSYSDSSVSPNTVYSYTVQAVNANGMGLASAPATATTPPAQVTGLVATALSSSSIGLTWNADAGATTYTVKRGSSVVGTPSGTSFTDTGLTASTLYTYTVAANGAGGQGAFSAPASATTQAGAAGIKFVPGFYGVFDYSGGVNSSRFTNGDSGIISALATNPSLGNAPDNLQGIAFIMTWQALDTGTTGPSYQRAVIDQYAGAARAKNKGWWLWVNWTSFSSNQSNASVTTGATCVPFWVSNQQGIINTTANFRRSDLNPPSAPGDGVFAKLYNTPVLNAYIGLINQIGAWYDSDPFFMGFIHGIGTATASFNGVDTLGTSQPHANYNADYTDTGMVSSLNAIMNAGRAAMPHSNFSLSCDYLFNMAGSSSYTGQDTVWTSIFNNVEAQKGMISCVDSWTNSWIYPQTPFSSTGQNSYLTPHSNASYNRDVYADDIYRGWRGPTPGVGTGFRGQLLRGGSIELTEMGGYIGQFSLADVMQYRGPAVDNSHFMFVDINYSQTGDYGTNPGVTPGAPKAPNTQWLASTSYDATYGQSFYRFIQGAGALNTVNPYP